MKNLLLLKDLLEPYRAYKYKYMTSLSKNGSIDKLDDIVNKYSKTYHSLIKLKPADVRSSTYIDFDKQNDKEDPEFKVGDRVRIQKYKSIFTTGYVPNWEFQIF